MAEDGAVIGSFPGLEFTFNTAYALLIVGVGHEILYKVHWDGLVAQDLGTCATHEQPLAPLPLQNQAAVCDRSRSAGDAGILSTM